MSALSSQLSAAGFPGPFPTGDGLSTCIPLSACVLVGIHSWATRVRCSWHILTLTAPSNQRAEWRQHGYGKAKQVQMKNDPQVQHF